MNNPIQLVYELDQTHRDTPMCGAQIAGTMTQAEMYGLIQGFLDAPAKIETDAPKPDLGFNVRPTQQVRIVSLHDGGLNMTTARWWFIPDSFEGGIKNWKATTFNARIETAWEKPTFASAWQHKRCIIPSFGYYEWTGAKGHKQPWFITPQLNEPFFSFAGLYSSLPNGLHTCTILTRAALPQIAHIHSRTPVMLSGQDIESWLRCETDNEDLIENLGTSFEKRMDFHMVRPFKTKDDGPQLLEPYEPPEQMGFAL